MPAPGEQHLAANGRGITNPFEEPKARISEYTAQEIATLQSRLEKQLGPEYISSRSGPSGQKVHYIASEKCIQLANEIFGFNGWSSQIMDVQVDFVDENPNTLKVSLGLSVIVRVTLRDGTFHEDVGYGHMENAKGKAAAFEKAKKEGTTDALKRTLRNFGNVLGNCIYDKDYLSRVTKMKAPQTKWESDKLHRHADFVPIVKKEDAQDEKSTIANGTARLITEDSLDDEFGEFDEADFSVADPDAHPDEVSLPAPETRSNHFNNKPPQNQIQTRSSNKPPQNAAGQRPLGTAPQSGNAANNQPQTPNQGFQRTNSGAERQHMPPPAHNRPLNAGSAGPPPVVGGRTLNQPSRAQSAQPSAPASPARPFPASDKDDISDVGLPPQGAGFFSARAAAALAQETSSTADTASGAGPLPAKIPTNLPAFDPHAESPSIRKTPGVDHKSSKPVGRDGRHVPSASQGASSINGAAGFSGAGGMLGGRGPLDGQKRMIGAPHSPSPVANRGSYKPPTLLKRPADSAGRVPLNDLPANGPVSAVDGPDSKRQRTTG